MALALLVNAKIPVRCFYLKIWLEDEVAHLNECPWEEDLGYAQATCDQLGVPLETISLQREYWDMVVQYTFAEAKRGLTPNPDVMCNSRVKFGVFYEYVGRHFRRVATGHYARIGRIRPATSDHTATPGEADKEEPMMVEDPLGLMEAKTTHALKDLLSPTSPYEGARKNNPFHEKKEEKGWPLLEFDDNGVVSSTGADAVAAAEPVSSNDMTAETAAVLRWLCGLTGDDDQGRSESLSSHVHEDAGTYVLYRSPDAVKDQTYFLCALTQKQLSKAIFPIGHLRKPQVRELAESMNLPTAARKDSQGICFLGKLKFSDFIGTYLGECPGDIVDVKTGDILGRHRGLWFHTIGQRKGLGPYLTAPGTVNAGPWYVVGKDTPKNAIYVSNEEAKEAPNTNRSPTTFILGELVWSCGSAPPGLTTNRTVIAPSSRVRAGVGAHRGSNKQGLKALVQLRHGGAALPALLSAVEHRHGPQDEAHEQTDEEGDDGNNGRGARVRVALFGSTDKGIAPGQFAAIYVGDICLGSGIVLE